MRVLLVASLLVTMSGCDESLGPTVPIDEEFVLAPGESAVVEDASIRFVRVAADSRCPADANCVWQGDARVDIVVTTGQRPQDYELHTSEPKPLTHGAYTIHLVQLQPYPFSSKTITPEEYRVTLKVAK